MSETKRTLEQVLKAIKGSDGIKTQIAENLGVTRQTVDAYLRRWATARLAYDEECERVGDLAESVVYRNIELAQEKQKQKEIADTSDAKWYLSRVRRDKFATKQEVEHGGKVEGELSHTFDLSGLNDDDLDKLGKIIAKAAS